MQLDMSTESYILLIINYFVYKIRELHDRFNLNYNYVVEKQQFQIPLQVNERLRNQESLKDTEQKRQRIIHTLFKK